MRPSEFDDLGEGGGDGTLSMSTRKHLFSCITTLLQEGGYCPMEGDIHVFPLFEGRSHACYSKNISHKVGVITGVKGRLAGKCVTLLKPTRIRTHTSIQHTVTC